MMTSCRCGHNLSSFRNVPPLPELDASFVHLVQEETSVVKPTEILLKIVTQGSDDHWLCGECLERAARVLQDDVGRLEDECAAYDLAVETRRERVEQWKRTLGQHWVADDEGGANVLQRTEQAFLDELAVLQQAISQQEAELEHLQQLRREQLQIEQELDQVDEAIAHEHSELSLTAQAIQNEQRQLAQSLYLALEEQDMLVSVNLYDSLYRLQIDEARGLRYPLINDLRLAPCPKGDLEWDEIQIAWSHVALWLLLLCPNMAKWRIIPLTASCAKLISPHGTVYNLGKDVKVMAQGLQALVQLLGSTFNSQEWPHPITIFEGKVKMGDLTVSDLPVTTEDMGWSKVIHNVACNVRHLSQSMASERQLQLRGLIL